MSTYNRRSNLAFTLKRLTRFLGILKSNKRGMLGITILVVYSALALSASFLTPWDPAFDLFVSGDFATPYWLRYVTSNPIYSENMNMLSKAGFPTSASLLEEWSFTTTDTSSARLSLAYDPSFGNKAPGSAAITFTRQAGKYSTEVVEAHLSKQFNYPFSGPPKRFEAKIAWLTEETEKLQTVELVLTIQRLSPDPATYSIWSTKLYKTTTTWSVPDPSIDSYHSSVKMRVGNITSDPARIIFPSKGEFVYDLRMRFVDSPTTVGNVQATLYLDDLDIKFFGTSFGLLGTDHQGRDIFTELAHGARISLFVGLLSALISVVFGLAIGLVAGYLGRIADEVLMRFTDMLLVLPSLPLLIVLIAVLGPSIWNLILLIGVLGWMSFARIVRSQVVSLKERPFVEAAKAVGAGKFHIILSHILPNVMSLVYVSLALAVPSAILAEAALSWLGLFDPRVVSWGRMLNEAQFQQGIDKWWWIVPPGISIALVSLSFVLLGYALDEILNPKLRQRR